MFTTNELSALISLIEFHDDWDEVSELLGADMEQLFNKLHSMLSYSSQG